VFTQVASVTVPAGSYTLAFKALVGNSAAMPALVECYLYEAVGPLPAQLLDGSGAPLFANDGAPGSWQTMTLLATRVTPPVPNTTFFVRCANNAANGFVEHVWLIATKIGALH
jgi:hypothetical protein